MSNLKLIIGLGNPGKEYAKTRHNAGFMVIDKIALDFDLGKPSSNKSYDIWIWKPLDVSSKVLLVKPLTYMNNSGEAVMEVMKFFKIGEEDLYVIQDDIDMPLGTIRLKTGGGAGGHHGIESLQQFIGHDEFRRIKLGIGRPAGEQPVEDYVLRPFLKEEEQLRDKTIDEASKIVVELVTSERVFKEEAIRVTGE